MTSPISIFWFRQDLRLSDNPGLTAASQLGAILPIYILDSLSAAPIAPAASNLYLHHSLEKLHQSLDNHLNIYKGDPKEILFHLIKTYPIEKILWNRCYEPWHLSKDALLEKNLRDWNVPYEIFNGSYLWTPEEVKKEDGTYYKVFGAYKKKARLICPKAPLPCPKNLVFIKDYSNKTTLHDLRCFPGHAWQHPLKKHWDFGEEAAHKKLETFLHHSLSGYKKGRNYPAEKHTSNLSVHLHFGELSPHQVWKAVHDIGPLHAAEEDIDCFLSEMIWREFSCYLMVHCKKMASDPFQAKFNAFPWAYNHTFFKAWKTGRTGYPFIDAGMRELWQTGYMHNRLRMIVASFLVKNLMVHWHDGRDWFWDCLMDADFANNTVSWQWVAGCGTDAAPFFRLFNPITQGETYDPYGQYTKKFIPELEKLPIKYLFKPWEAPEKVLQDAGIILGVTYPNPIVDFKTSRIKALSAYKALELPSHDPQFHAQQSIFSDKE
jgi:deoxyribodipyrimidine photo-lyase